MKLLLLLVLAGFQILNSAASIEPEERAWNYVGVPYPDWEYDPFTYPAPTAPAEWPGAAHVGFYFIAPNDANATDQAAGGEPVDGNGKRYGFPAKPRLTLPLVSANTNTFPAGTVLWLKGGTYKTTLGASRDISVEMNGTPEAPCWIYGDPDDKPGFDQILVSLYATEYAFLENLVWGKSTGGYGGLMINRSDKNGQSHHITVRHNSVQDRNYYNHSSFFTANGPAVGKGGIDADVHDVVFYRNTFKNCGGGVDWDITDADLHGYKLDGIWGGNRSYRIWLIEDRVELGDLPDPIDKRRKSLSGNYAQIGDQNVGTGNVDHVYVAGAVTEGMRQSCVYLKRCGHIVVSSNICRDLAKSATSQAQAFGTKYDRQENQWFVNNYAENVDSFFIRAEATSSGAGGPDTFLPANTRVHIIGNIFKNCLREPFNAPDAGGIGGWKTKGIAIQEMRGKVYIANNVVDRSVYGVYFSPHPGRQAKGAEMHVYNNLATRLVAGQDTSTAAVNGIMVTTDTSTTAFYMENNLVDSGRYYFAGTQYASASAFNARANAAENKQGDPLFSNAEADDYTLSATSPAIDAGVQDYTTNESPDVYQLFVDAFANDPDFPGNPADVWPRDWKGNPRFQGRAIDIGPSESPDSARIRSPEVVPKGFTGGRPPPVK